MELLNEIWQLIFIEHLDFVDIIQCRRVSKRFKSLVDQLRPTELLIYDHASPISLDITLRDYRSPSKWIQVYQLELKPDSSFHILFANLRVLQLNMSLGKTMPGEKEIDLEFLNQFVRLEKLYLDKVVISRNQTLRLPNLKVLAIDIWAEELQRDFIVRLDKISRLVLDSKVQRLSCPYTTSLDIKHPELVEFLQCYASDLVRYPPIRFPNLRVLRVMYLHFLFESTLIPFETPESLEELHLELVWDEQMLELNPLMTRRATLRREVKLYASGVCLPFNGRLETPTDDLEDDFVANRIWYYHRLADQMWGVKRLRYEELVDCLHSLLPARVELDDWRFPVGFFEKFLNIRKVEIERRVEDEDRFLYFLSRCTSLIELYFGRRHLTQSLIDRLPAACRQLKVFTIYTLDRFSGLDLRPVYGLKQLFRLGIGSNDAHLDGPLDLLTLFESCRYLVKVELKHIRIEKRKLYHVCIPDEASLKRGHLKLQEWAALKYDDLRMNLDTIIEECKEMRRRTNSHQI